VPDGGTEQEKTVNDSSQTKYPLLDGILAIQNLPLQPMNTTRDVAGIFKVCVRAIQNWISSVLLKSRNLPGRWRFLRGTWRTSLGPAKSVENEVLILPLFSPYLRRDRICKGTALTFGLLLGHPRDYLTIWKILWHSNINTTIRIYGSRFNESSDVCAMESWLEAREAKSS
jgi:hypothetical protein